MRPDDPKRAEQDGLANEAGSRSESIERTAPERTITHGPKRTIMQWKPPAAATQQGLSVERLRQVVDPNQPTADAPIAQHADPRVSAEAYANTEAGGMSSPVSLPPPAPLNVGDIVGDRYLIEQHISSGGFGSVYRASDKQISNHQVALKLLHKPAASEEERESALRELQLIASVSHPSVVQFKDYGWRDGCLWFAMPWYRGHTLAERLSGLDEGAGPEPMKRAVAHPIFERLAQGLAAMHEVGIYHHDIKPENVFLADIAGFDGGLPVLLDLGISTKRGEKPKGLTIEYAAPETAAAALGEPTGPIGGPADVFSLALVLRNALEPSTAPPLDADNALAILQRRANEPVAPPSSRELRYLKPYFERWLSLDPDARPTANELASEFAQLVEPEVQRKARVRLLKRLVPIVLISAALLAGLYYQLRQQATVLKQQSTQLTKEKQMSEQARRESESRLKELEENEEQLGNERERFKDAVAIAKGLRSDLAEEKGRSSWFEKRGDRLAKEKSDLVAEKAGLISERDQLQRARDQLTGERDNLIGERNRLNAERALLIADRDELDRKVSALDRERDELKNDLASRKAELSLAKSELKTVENELSQLRGERKELAKRVSELQQERDRVEAQRRALERQLNQQGGSKPSGGTTTEPTTPGSETGSDKPKRGSSRPTLDPSQTGGSWR